MTKKRLQFAILIAWRSDRICAVFDLFTWNRWFDGDLSHLADYCKHLCLSSDSTYDRINYYLSQDGAEWCRGSDVFAAHDLVEDRFIVFMNKTEDVFLEKFVQLTLA